LNQNYQDWAHIIVNDGGDPKPINEIVEAHQKEYSGRCAVFHHERSLGMETASNAGIKGSDSDAIVILDDDDTWAPSFLETCMSRLENKRHPSVRGVVTHAIQVLEKVIPGQDLPVEVNRRPFNQYLRSISLSELSGGNIITTNAFVYERNALDEIGFYREDLPVLGDWEFNLRFVFQYEIDLICESLSYFHHRIALHSGASANSVVAASSEHCFYATFILNEFLRKDLKSGKFGLGSVMNIHIQRRDIEKRFLLYRAIHWIKRKCS